MTNGIKKFNRCVLKLKENNKKNTLLNQIKKSKSSLFKKQIHKQTSKFTVSKGNIEHRGYSRESLKHNFIKPKEESIQNIISLYKDFDLSKQNSEEYKEKTLKSRKFDSNTDIKLKSPVPPVLKKTQTNSRTSNKRQMVDTTLNSVLRKLDTGTLESIENLFSRHDSLYPNLASKKSNFTDTRQTKSKKRKKVYRKPTITRSKTEAVLNKERKFKRIQNNIQKVSNGQYLSNTKNLIKSKSLNQHHFTKHAQRVKYLEKVDALKSKLNLKPNSKNRNPL